MGKWYSNWPGIGKVVGSVPGPVRWWSRRAKEIPKDKEIGSNPSRGDQTRQDGGIRPEKGGEEVAEPSRTGLQEHQGDLSRGFSEVSAKS